MSDISLTKLPKTQFTGLNKDNIISDIQKLIRENPEYNENWEDFLESNAGTMLVEMFAWIADALATRIDWFADENYITTATQKSSVIKLLKLIGYKFSLPVASEVPVTITFENNIGTYTLTPAYSEGSGVLNLFALTAKDKNGNTRNYEALIYDSENSKYDYKLPVTVDSSASEEIDFYEGTTYIDNVISTTDDGPVFTLSNSPVIANSVRVYKVTGTEPNLDESELLQVDSFLDIRAQQTETDGTVNAVPYIINVLDENIVQVEFASAALLPSSNRRLPEESELYIFYRVGGGLNGNISKGSINVTQTLTLDSGGTVSATFKNLLQGVSGSDGETADHAAYYGPLSIKTVGKTVTEEDYDIVLNSHSNILASKSYGYHNIPDDYYLKYGRYINPMEVLNFIVMKKSGWEDVPPSKYKYANFGSFNLENRFNGKYAFTTGEFAKQLNYSTAVKDTVTYSGSYDYDGLGGRTFYNYVILDTPSAFGDALYVDGSLNPDMQASITTTKFDRQSHDLIEDIGNHYIDKGNDSFLTPGNTMSISLDTNAYLIGEANLSNGINISAVHNITLDIDERGPVLIDLSNGGTSPDLLPLETDGGTTGAIDLINNALDTAYDSGVNSYMDFGISICDTTDYVSTLENKDEEDWYLGIIESPGGAVTQYTINTGTDQTYENMLTQLNLGLNTYGYTASFVQNKTNIACYDIRISTDGCNYIELADTESTYDILSAFGALPISTSYMACGDYSNVAYKYTDANGKDHLGLQSPNVGDASSIQLIQSVSNDASAEVFDLDYSDVTGDRYICYGKRSFTVIARDDTADDWANIIYENGSINFMGDDNEVLYLNYLSGHNEYVQLGHYFNANFEVTDPEYRPVTHRLYNMQYKIDPTDPEESYEIVDMDSSNILLRFTNAETDLNSIFVITNDYSLTESSPATITSTTLDSFPYFATDRYLKLTIDDETALMDLNSATSLSSLISTINSNFTGEPASQVSGEEKMKLTGTDEIDGQIIIHNLSSNNAATRIFEASDISDTTEVTLNYDTTTISEVMASIDTNLADAGASGVETYVENAAHLGDVDLGSGYDWNASNESFLLTYNEGGTTDIEAYTEGNVDLSSGHDWGAASQTFDLAYDSVGGSATTVTLDATCADIDAVVTEINDGLTNAGLDNYFIAYKTDNDLYIGIKTRFKGSVEEFTLADGGGGALATLGWTADTYTGTGNEKTDYITLTANTANIAAIVAEIDTALAASSKFDFSTVMEGYNDWTNEKYVGLKISANTDNKYFTLADATAIDSSLTDALATLGWTAASYGNKVGIQTTDAGAGQQFTLYNGSLNNALTTLGWSATSFSGSDATAASHTGSVDMDATTTTWGTTSEDFYVTTPSLTDVQVILNTNTSSASAAVTEINDELATAGLDTYVEAFADGVNVGIRTVNTGYSEWFQLKAGSTTDALATLGWTADYYRGTDDLAAQELGTTDLSDGNSWGASDESFSISVNGAVDTTFYTEGDYSLVLNETTDSFDMYLTNNPDTYVPDLEFYIHFVADRRHEFDDPDQEKVHTDEDDIKSFLYPYKVAGIENTFFRPVFDTFDIQGTIYVESVFNPYSVKLNVEENLRDRYSLENTNFGETIEKSEIINIVLNTEGVRFMSITYFGLDATRSSSNVNNTIEPSFDELIVLSDDVYEDSKKVHGLLLEYTNV